MPISVGLFKAVVGSAPLRSRVRRGSFQSIPVIAAAIGALIAFPCAGFAKQFSLNCESYAPYFVTFDTEAKRVVFESFGGSALKGIITDQQQGETRFELIRVAKPRVRGIWRSDSREMVWRSQTQAAPNPWDVHRCAETALRSTIAKYDEISPFEQDKK